MKRLAASLLATLALVGCLPADSYNAYYRVKAEHSGCQVARGWRDNEWLLRCEDGTVYRVDTDRFTGQVKPSTLHVVFYPAPTEDGP